MSREMIAGVAPKQRVWGQVLAAAIAAAFMATAAAEDLFAQRYPLRHYRVEHGLPSDQVRSLGQDAEGRLWLATRAGIAVYDGDSWAGYGLSEGLSWADQRALRWDDSGRLWSVGSFEPFPVFGFDDGRWTGLPEADGSVPGGGISGFEILGPETSEGVGEPEVFVGTREGGLLWYRRGAWRRLGREEGVVGAVHGLAVWKGQLLVATRQGVGAFADGRLRSGLHGGAELSLPPGGVGGMTVDAYGAPRAPAEDLWLVGDTWIRHVSAGGVETYGGLDLGPFAGGRRLAADRLGGVYFTAGDGVDSPAVGYFHPVSGLGELGPDNGLDVGPVQDLLFDREGNLWIAGDRGVAKLSSRRMGTFDRHTGLFDSEVSAILEEPDGTLVLGHRGGISFLGDRRVDTRSLPLTTEDGRRVEPVRDLARDDEGNLWIAAELRGVLRLDTAGKVRSYDLGGGGGTAATALAWHPEWGLWVATDGGLRVLRGDRLTAAPGEVPGVHVRRLSAEPGAILAATSEGLLRYDGASWTRQRCADGGACDSTFALLADGAGGHWVGTAAGLATTRGGRLAPVDDGPAAEIAEPVFFIVRDTDALGGERLWLGTNDGVLRWDRTARRVQRLTLEDGLGGRETRRAAGLRDAGGRLWFGTDRGVTVFDPKFDRGRRRPPTVRLLDVTAGGRSWPQDEPRRLSSGVDDLVFRYRVVSLVDEDRVEVSAWLEGLDDGWAGPGECGTQEVRFSDLPPGEYRFHLRAAGAGGEWSEPKVSAPLVVARPVWRQPWFFVFLGIALLGGLYTVQGFAAQRRTARLLEREVARRVSELRASEDRYRKTFKGIDDGVITTDAEGRVELLNPRAKAITGWRAEAAEGLPVTDVLRLFRAETGGDSEPLSLLDSNLQDTIGPTQTALLETRKGERKAIEITASPVVTRGSGVTGLVFAFRDITRKRQVEEELARAQKLEAIGILAGGIAHDFNNLLTVLLGNLSLLQDTAELDTENRRSLIDAEKALLRARDLTHQLLTFSRGGAPVREAASIEEVLRDSASFVLRGSKVRCEIDIAPDLGVVEIDAGQISQVLNNLLINASQAMPSGGVVRIVARNTAAPPSPLPEGTFVLIEVVDHGIGIPEALQDKVFDPYFSTKAEGRGLGLASAYSIVKSHDGLLTVRSKPGGGTTFSIFLPVSDLRRSGGAAEGGTQAPFRGGGRVLLMDDDEVVMRTASAMLRRLGFEVVPSLDGRQAIDLYAQAQEEGEPFVAVMMDLTVPGGMGGQDAVKRLLQIDPGLVAVVYSGYSNDPVLANYRDYGFRGRLSKPFRLEDLAAVMAEVLGTQPSA
ncbi:MAG: ATP-binding protein [Acidobacteriota bacterium]